MRLRQLLCGQSPSLALAVVGSRSQDRQCGHRAELGGGSAVPPVEQPRAPRGVRGRGRRWRKWFLKEMRCEHSALALSVWPPASTALGKQGWSQEPRGWQGSSVTVAAVWQLLWAPAPSHSSPQAPQSGAGAGAAMASQQPHLCHAGSVIPCAAGQKQRPRTPLRAQPLAQLAALAGKDPCQEPAQPFFCSFLLGRD